MRPCYLEIDLLDVFLAEYFRYLLIYNVGVLGDWHCSGQRSNLVPRVSRLPFLEAGERRKGRREILGTRLAKISINAAISHPTTRMRIRPLRWYEDEASLILQLFVSYHVKTDNTARHLLLQLVRTHYIKATWRRRRNTITKSTIWNVLQC